MEPNGHMGPSGDSMDVVGGPFAVIESDPGVFTGLIRSFGVRNLEVIEIYDIEPWAVDHVNPYGLIFCFLYPKVQDQHVPSEFSDPQADLVWFANQLSNDACASQAALNVLLNCSHEDVELGEELRMFREQTREMSSVMRGLAISNAAFIREAHNALARPADVRGALNAIATTTVEVSKKAQSRAKSKPPAKRRKMDEDAKRRDASKKQDKDENPEQETYHFIGYVPAYGKVWELDGLKSGPLEVGELPDPNTTKGWMDIARPALRMKMRKYGGIDSDQGQIRFNLLAIVKDQYQTAHDDLELLKRERARLERRLNEAFPNDAWKEKVDPTLPPLLSTFPLDLQPPFSASFGSLKQIRDVEILDMAERSLPNAWETCARRTIESRVRLEDEEGRARQAQTEHIERTHDYEPFLVAFLTRLHQQSLLNPLLGLDENGRKVPTRAK